MSGVGNASDTATMNCFEWQNQLSDILDGTLNGARKKAADSHLESCRRCAERERRYRLLLSAISNESRTPLPVSIRKNPLTALVPSWEYLRERAFESSGSDGLLGRARIRWRRIPWHLRTSLEGALIVGLVLVLTSSGPRLRSFYESKIERSLVEFSQTFNGGDSTAAPAAAPLARGRVNEPAPTASGIAPALDDLATEGDDSPDDPSASAGSGSEDTEEVVARDGEIWRFMLKTDSPYEVRKRVIQILGALKVPQDAPEIGGIEAPGGIQFNLLLPKGVIPQLKKQLGAINPPVPEGLGNTPEGETFTWYKSRSRQPIPSGKVRVAIWLSQI